MAYRHFLGAPFLYCWCDGNHICVEELSGRINKYSCAINVTIEKQLTTFHGPDAVWCLSKDGILYVGRNDSTFSGFRESDGVLVRYGPWAYPCTRSFDVVGWMEGYSAALDSDDRKTVYVHDRTRAFILNDPINVEPELVQQSMCYGDRSPDVLSICTEGGPLNVKSCGAWVNAPQPKWGYIPVQL